MSKVKGSTGKFLVLCISDPRHAEGRRQTAFCQRELGTQTPAIWVVNALSLPPSLSRFFLCMCAYTHVSVCLCLYVCVCTHVCPCVCVLCMCVHVCVCCCMFLCVFLCFMCIMHVCLCLCVLYVPVCVPVFMCVMHVCNSIHIYISL